MALFYFKDNQGKKDMLLEGVKYFNEGLDDMKDVTDRFMVISSLIQSDINDPNSFIS